MTLWEKNRWQRKCTESGTISILKFAYFMRTCYIILRNAPAPSSGGAPDINQFIIKFIKIMFPSRRVWAEIFSIVETWKIKAPFIFVRRWTPFYFTIISNSRPDTGDTAKSVPRKNVLILFRCDKFNSSIPSGPVHFVNWYQCRREFVNSTKCCNLLCYSVCIV